MKALILGGARSGKSKLAEQYATESQLSVCYIATSEPTDKEMSERVRLHRERRPDHWGLVEEPIKLADVLKAQATSETCILVDCLTLWLTNLLMLEDQSQFDRERQALLDVLPILPGQIIMVSNETNMGVVPMGELTRKFCDEAGLLHQAVAEISEQVILTVAGLPHFLKGHA